MKIKMQESIELPEGISCSIEGNIITCKKGSIQLSRKIDNPLVNGKVEGNKIVLNCEKGSKNEFKMMKSYIAHIKNMFEGLKAPYVYKLESANVHFPMTLKADKEKLVVSNFLGEKTPRFAKILPNVTVEIKGQKITITSTDKEAAGQTAANFEKATKIRNRDRRIFQDGIFITDKPIPVGRAE